MNVNFQLSLVAFLLTKKTTTKKKKTKKAIIFFFFVQIEIILHLMRYLLFYLF